MKAKIELIDKAIDNIDNLILKSKPVPTPLYDTVVVKAINPHKELVKDEKAYTKLITNILSEQATTTSNFINDWEGMLTDRYDFFDSIEPELNKILYDAVPSMEKHIEGFYNVGKANGFDEMKVASFFGESDKHALYTLKNYNFDLIKNASQNLKDNVREAVWQGTARGDTLQSIAKEIKVPKLVTSDGKVISSEVRALSIARTESMQAMNQGHLLSYQQYGIEQVEVLDSGTEGDFNCECPDIVAGSPYKIDENLPVLPAHTNCTHTYSPVGMPTVDGAMDVDTYVNLVLGGETPVASV